MKLRVTRKGHARPEGGRVVTYWPGDTFDGTERELKAFSDRLERVASKPRKKKAASKDASDSEPSQSDSRDES